jgi:hypothetical protein
MNDENQAAPPGVTPAFGSIIDPPAPPPPESTEPPGPGAEAAAHPAADDRGLGIWLLVLLVCGAGGLLFGMQEMAALVAIAGLFVAAQAADADSRWRALYYLISWVVPAGGAVGGLVIAFAIAQSDLSGFFRFAVMGMSVASAGISLLMLFRPISDPLARVLFRVPPSHTLRLAARMVAMTFMLAIPAWFAFRYVLDSVIEDPSILLERVSLGGELIGYVLLALATVGYMVRRDLGSTLERLGIRPITTAHVATIAIGVVALFALNTGADAVERMFLPGLWKSDQAFNETLASGLGPGRILLLGLSAGIGEEITLRGALQPKLGLFLTSLLFASLHVQYSWFGVTVIFLLGMLLGTIRSRTSTSVAMAVHVLYDIVAVFSV